MARVTVEDCIEKVENRFELIIAASQRAREISNGVQIEVDKDNDKNTVISLREIGDGAITYDDLKERYLKSLQKVVVNNDEDEENDIEEEFSSYLNQEETDQNLNPNNFFKNTDKLFNWISKSSGKIKIRPDQKLFMEVQLKSREEKIENVLTFIDDLKDLKS